MPWRRLVTLFSSTVLTRTLLVLAVLLAAGWGIYRLSIPHYKGKSVGYWFDNYPYGGLKRRDSIAAFQAMSPDGVRYLISELEAERPSLGPWFQSLRSVIFRRPGGYNESAWLHRKARACEILGDMGPSAQSAVPHLETASSNSMWYVWTSARAALIKIRDESPAPFIEELRDTSDPMQWFPKAMLVSELGTNASTAVPLLIDALQHSNEIVIGHALIALGKIESLPEVCVPALTPFLTNGSVSTRQKAFYAVLRFGESASSAADAIIAGLSDPDPWNRSQALLAVKDVLRSQDQKRALAQCEALLKDPDPYVRKRAKERLPVIRAAASGSNGSTLR